MARNIGIFALCTLFLGVVFLSPKISYADSLDCSNNVCVSTWLQLKNAVETIGGTIYVLNDIEADIDNPITEYVSGTIINGQGFTLSMPENDASSSNGRFFEISTTQEDPLIVDNVNMRGGFYSTGSDAYGGVIRNEGNIGNISENFIGNYVKSNTGVAFGGVIYI